MNQNVLRLDVAMDDALPVRVVERGGHLPREVERLIDAELFVTTEPVAQRFAAHERQDVIGKSACHPGVDEREDVRVMELRADPYLVQEPVDTEQGGEL